MTGETISHFEILDKLGEGGMGVVYKARDTRLNRFVAIKVLPADKVANAERKRRFIQEARAASALNHPNIVTIYEIDQADGVDFMVMEYVQGRTLGRAIGRRGLALGEVLKCGVQAADALAKAHAAGILHRDLKPGNIMVTEDGVVKILDFGLAKLIEPGVVGEADVTRSIRDDDGPRTEEGVVVGTAAYMSPEQARGEKVDARSDIFSFGVVLYEMVTGRRAFPGESRAETLAAVLNKDPGPVSEVAAGVPRELSRMIGRCLRKDPERRFQHISDLKVQLAELKEESDSGTLAAAVAEPAVRSRRSWLWPVALAVVGVAFVVAWFFRPSPNVAQPENVAAAATPLTSYPGREMNPSFSPDGSRVVFQWEGEDRDNWDLYIKLIGEDSLQRLTGYPAEDISPAWSPDGRRIAFVRKGAGGAGEVMIVPSIGGRPRSITRMNFLSHRIVTPNLAWHPDGEHLFVSSRDESGAPYIKLLAVSTGEVRPVTSPDTAGTRHVQPSVSPDGRAIAFVSAAIPWVNAIQVLELTDRLEPAGAPRTLTTDHFPAHPVWTADGREIIFSAGGQRSSLWRVPAAGGEPRPVTPRREGSRPVLSPAGNRLAFVRGVRDHDIWRARLPGGASAAPLISSTWGDESPQYSPDGQRIAFASTRSGFAEIWVSDADGSHARPLTDLRSVMSGGPFWSPDGRQIVFDSVLDVQRDVMVIRAAGGQPRNLTDHPAQDAQPTWSRDGKWIYFSSDRSGDSHIWKMPAEGGEAVKTPFPGDYALESWDGRTVFYTNEHDLWSSGGGGPATRLLSDAMTGSQDFTAARDGLYFAPRATQGQPATVGFIDGRSGEVRTLFTMSGPRYVGLSVSPDGSNILFTQTREPEADIMLVESFR